MLNFSNTLRVSQARILVVMLGCMVSPVMSWAVNIGGQVGLTNKSNNQPTLQIQITGTIRPELKTDEAGEDSWWIFGGIPWRDSDAHPPPYTEADGKGNFNMLLGIDLRGDFGGEAPIEPQSGILVEKGPEHNGATDSQNGGDRNWLDTSRRASLKYQLSAGYEGYYSEQTFDADKLFAARLALNPKLSINNYSNYIDFWNEGLDVEKAGQQFERDTGNSVSGWEKYFGDGQAKPWLSTAWATPNVIRNDFNWGLGKDHWTGSENNAVTNIAPAQGLYPHTWPIDEEASPLPMVYYRRTHHE